jgi:hypothetical protein
MIAHGFVVVDYFLLQTLFTEGETRTDEMGGIRTQALKFASMF